jgi:biotin-[acetyl-CoA-carboxylase] ligase BirA-like protein
MDRRMMTIEPIEFHLPEVSSTNDYAKELLGTYPYVLVSARVQTRGRGRKGRVWEGAMDANVYCSIGIRHGAEIGPEDAAAFMARGALAVLHVLRRLLPNTPCRLKYPNDVHVRTPTGWAKIAGILVEHEYIGMRCHTTVVGIGVNVAQETFPDTITQPCTSLRLLGVHADVSDVINDVKHAFTGQRQLPWQMVHDAWSAELRSVASSIRLEGEGGTWTIARILNDGRLILRHEVSQTERTVSDGDTLRYED